MFRLMTLRTMLIALVTVTCVALRLADGAEQVPPRETIEAVLRGERRLSEVVVDGPAGVRLVARKDQDRVKKVMAWSPAEPTASISWEPLTPAFGLAGILPLQTKAPEAFVVALQIVTSAGFGERSPVR